MYADVGHVGAVSWSYVEYYIPMDNISLACQEQRGRSQFRRGGVVRMGVPSHYKGKYAECQLKSEWASMSRHVSRHTMLYEGQPHIVFP